MTRSHHPLLRTAIAMTTLAAPLVGCNDDGSDGADDLADDTGDTGDTGLPSDLPPPPESLAHDIDLALVEFNQGVAVPIAVDGEWVDAPSRNAPVVAGRNALIRGYWATTPEFTPREIEARLRLRYADGTEVEQRQTKLIDAPTFAGDLDRSFLFDLVEAEVEAGMDFSISLWEVDPEHAALPDPPIAPISPRDGALAPIGVQSEAAEIKVVVVPVQVDWPGCSSDVPAAELLPIFEDMLFMKNPAQAVRLELRPQALVLDSELFSFWELFPTLQDLREQDGAADNVYYYAVMDACSTGDIGGAGGMAYSVTPAGAEFAWQRVAAGLYFGDEQWAADTFVHEIGHLQGLAHVYCPGQNAAEPDPEYPYEDGIIGVWGFGLRDFELRSPTVAHDFMSYCYDGNWSSDWTWSKTFDRIRTLTSWDQQAPAPDPGAAVVDERREIRIWLTSDEGERRSWTTRGRIPAEVAEVGDRAQPQPRAWATLADGRRLQLPALRQRLADGAATVVAVELPPIPVRALEIDDVAVSW